MNRHISQTWTQFLRAGFHITQVEYWDQTRNTRTLYLQTSDHVKSLWTLSKWTEIGFEIFSLRTFFAQYLSSSSLASGKWEVRTWSFGQIFRASETFTNILWSTELPAKNFLSRIFDSTFIQQVIDLSKVRGENLKNRTDLRDWTIFGWSITRKSKVVQSVQVLTWISDISLHLRSI